MVQQKIIHREAKIVHGNGNSLLGKSFQGPYSLLDAGNVCDLTRKMQARGKLIFSVIERMSKRHR